MGAVAMVGSRCAPVRSLGSLHSLCGDQAEVRRSCGVAFADRSHESFYALRVRCGKKDSAKALRGRVAKVQELVRAQRELFAAASSRDAEGSVLQIAMSDSVVEQMIKNLQQLQVEVESLNVKAMKKLGKKSGSSSSSSSSSSSAFSESDDAGTAMAGAMKTKNKKKKGGSSSSSSSSSSSESSDSNRGKAMSMRALRKSRVSATDPIPPVPSPVAMPSSLISAERLAAGISAAVSASEDHSSHEEEPAIVAQIRALCNTASTSTAANTRESFTRGPIELKETPSGRVIGDTPVAPVVSDAITSGKIEVCTVGKCRRGGSQGILASLQASIPESSNISVTSCKCMGKCKSAPNVRVRNGEGQRQLHSHVSVDDVDTLLAFHFGGVGNQMPVLVASLDSDGLA